MLLSSSACDIRTAQTPRSTFTVQYTRELITYWISMDGYCILTWNKGFAGTPTQWLCGPLSGRVCMSFLNRVAPRAQLVPSMLLVEDFRPLLPGIQSVLGSVALLGRCHKQHCQYVGIGKRSSKLDSPAHPPPPVAWYERRRACRENILVRFRPWCALHLGQFATRVRFRS